MLTSKDLLLITNNQQVLEAYGDTYDVKFMACTYLDVFYEARSKIHCHYKLMTHPMAGSLKPNQTPYKSILLMPTDELDTSSVQLIENAIESAQKFLKLRSLPNWTDHILKDFRTLDVSYIEGAVSNKIEHYI